MARPERASHLGWLGPAIVLVGAAVAAAGIWFFLHAKPVPGDVIDTLVIDPHTSIVVRGEATSDRAFVELYDDGELRWQALVPRYAGKRGVPGIAWSPTAVSIRVIRDGHAEIFAIASENAAKLASIRLAPQHGAVVVDAPGPITLTDHIRSFELVAGPDWHQLVALDLRTGKALWEHELGPEPVRDAGLAGTSIWVAQGVRRRSFGAVDGVEALPSPDGASTRN